MIEANNKLQQTVYYYQDGADKTRRPGVKQSHIQLCYLIAGGNHLMYPIFKAYFQAEMQAICTNCRVLSGWSRLVSTL